MMSRRKAGCLGLGRWTQVSYGSKVHAQDCAAFSGNLEEMALFDFFLLPGIGKKMTTCHAWVMPRSRGLGVNI